MRTDGSEQEHIDDILADITAGNIVVANPPDDPFGFADADSHFTHNRAGAEFPVFAANRGRLTNVGNVLAEIAAMRRRRLRWLELGTGMGIAVGQIAAREHDVDGVSLTALAPHYVPHLFYGVNRGEPSSLPTGDPPPVFARGKRYIGKQFIGPLTKKTPLPKGIYDVAHECRGPLHYSEGEDQADALDVILRALEPEEGVLAACAHYPSVIQEIVRTRHGGWRTLTDPEWIIVAGPSSILADCEQHADVPSVLAVLQETQRKLRLAFPLP
ncbi:MAG: hypothetical protein G01um101425_793 [Candidatus Peregrinibacteria bacterium Gr01-1014_25]|nr:MAG: hypothetical protein G01um101425_793 [Candidatus Peregrinibacteria bacterium Gr01-1014_25]